MTTIAQVGTEFRVNTQTAGYQMYPSAAGLAGGGFAVAWTDSGGTLGDSDGSSVKAKVFDGTGALVRDEFLVNTQTDRSQFDPHIASLANGGFAVVWEDNAQGDLNVSLKAKLFNAAGGLVRDEFTVDANAYGPHADLSVAGLTNGGFVATWKEDNQNSDPYDDSFRAKVFDPAGGVVQNEFLVSTGYVGNDATVSSVASLAGGGFVVVWAGNGSADGYLDVKAKLFDASGTLVRDEFRINTETKLGQYDPSVTGLANGGFVVAWEDESRTSADGDKAVKAKVLDATGAVVKDEFLVDSHTEWFQINPSVAALAGGGFVIAWEDASGFYGGGLGDSDVSVKAKVYGASGALLEDEFRVNTKVEDYQTKPSVAGLANGGFVITWGDERWESGGLGDYSPPRGQPQLGGAAIDGQIYAFDANGIAPGAGPSKPLSVSDLLTKPASETLVDLVDFSGIHLGGVGAWKIIGQVDVQNDFDLEYVLTNSEIGRWATLGPNANGIIDLAAHGWGGDTRVVGIYIDPLVEQGLADRGGPFDSQARFANDLATGNIGQILGAADYNDDHLQEIYFRTTDKTAYLHAYMHADGNIQYANYQNAAQVQAYLTEHGYGAAYWGDWM